MRKATGNMGIDRAEALKFQHLGTVSEDAESDELPRNLRSLAGGRTDYLQSGKTPGQRAKDMRFRRIMIIAGAVTILLMYIAEDSVMNFLLGAPPKQVSDIYVPYVPPKSRPMPVRSPELTALKAAFCSVPALNGLCMP